MCFRPYRFGGPGAVKRDGDLSHWNRAGAIVLADDTTRIDHVFLADPLFVDP